jgi:hypothetical protein
MTDPTKRSSHCPPRASAFARRSEAHTRDGSGQNRGVSDRRIRHSKETNGTLQRIRAEPTRANIVALHEMHATHLREMGDEEGATRADERAKHARNSAVAGFDRSSLPARFRPLAAVGDVRHPGSFDEAAPMTPAGQDRAGETTQVRNARAGSQRADAALQRAVEGSDRADTHDARTKAGWERSAAARRRVHAAEARREGSLLRLPVEEARDDWSDERDRVADQRERTADERERIADERDRGADHRDKAADLRERAADQRETLANKRQRFFDAFDRGYKWPG